MATYIILATWTEQGIRDVKDSGARYDAFKELLRERGGEARETFMTMGGYDIVAVCDAPSDEVMAEVLLHVAKGGYLRTTTLKAFDEATYRRITAAVG
jgi:uncharacterized protein with GYD domain